MAGLSLDHPLAFAIGLLGNIISFLVYLAPLPTFYRVYKKKSTGGFQSVPYVVALFSAMLWIYYAFLKVDAFLLITINSIGCVIETIYIVIYLAYAPPKARIYTAKIILLLNVGLYLLVLLLTSLLSKGPNRIKILGWICMCFALSVFVAPLSIIRQVVRTKSVEFMPFNLSFSLTIGAIAWFSYGLVIKDLYVALPNVLGFSFGVLQMVLYYIYKDAKMTTKEIKLPEHRVVDVKITPSSSLDADAEANQEAIGEGKVGNKEGPKEEEIELSPV